MFYVLDACAMIAYLRGEPGAEVVEQSLLDATSQCMAHAINLCEVYYNFHRASGESAAKNAVADLVTLGVVERDDLSQTFWMAVGEMKAVWKKISLADCCAVVLTNRVGGTLLTSDHHELDALAADGVCPISFIR
ncbi:MAG: PIN domain-containing protein [Pyrinomonadaceae bacterium]